MIEWRLLPRFHGPNEVWACDVEVLETRHTRRVRVLECEARGLTIEQLSLLARKRIFRALSVLAERRHKHGDGLPK